MLEQTAPAGPSRSTRSAHSARVGALKAVPVSLQQSKKPSRTAKQNVDDGSFWSIVSEVKAREKGKAKAAHDQEDTLPEPSHQLPYRPAAVSESISTGPVYGNKHPRNRTVIQNPHPNSGLGEPPPNKRRKLGTPISTPHFPSPTKSSTDKMTPHDTQSPSIRRIKLIVRRPTPRLTNPDQKLPLPSHGGSLTNILNSFTILDEEEASQSELEEHAKERARFLNKVAFLRRQGYFLYTPEDGEKQPEPERQGGDIWDNILHEVETKAQSHLNNPCQGAAVVANRIKAYWESRAVKEDKLKAQEEKRLRSLAKATIRMVVSKWKEAVLHIREEERQKALDEERKRGHEHLDDILTRSGQILEAQQAELGKADLAASSRSQSSSLVTTPLPASPATSDNEDLGSDSDDEDTAHDSEEDADTAGLLGSVHSRSTTPPGGSISSRSSPGLPGSRSSSSVVPSRGSLELLAYPEDTDISSPIDLQPDARSLFPDPFTDSASLILQSQFLQPLQSTQEDEILATTSQKGMSFADEHFNDPPSSPTMGDGSPPQEKMLIPPENENVGTQISQVPEEDDDSDDGQDDEDDE